MILYKYLLKKHLLAFKNQGLVHVNTLHAIRSIEHEPIRDELEGHERLKFSSNKQIVSLSGKEFHQLIPNLKMNKQQEEKINIDVENGVEVNLEIANVFIFCASLKLDHSLSGKLGYDAYYKIVNPFAFANALQEKLNQVVTITGSKLGMVKYTDKPVTITKGNKSEILGNSVNRYLKVCFTKSKKFYDQREFRMVFVPSFRGEIKPIDLVCPELRRFCVF